MSISTRTRVIPETDLPPVAPPPVGARRWRWPSAQTVAWVWMIAIALVRAGSPQERDPYWGVVAGLENLAGQPLARPDVWSWAPAGGDWYQNSPGWNTVLALVWSLGGYWGLFGLTFVVLMSYFTLAYKLARRLGANELGALAGVLLSYLLAFSMLSVRATVVVQIMILAATHLLLSWGPWLKRQTPVIAGGALFGVGVLWSAAGTWFHLSFPAVALATAVAWTGYWLVSDWPGWRARLADGTRWAAALGGGLGLGLGLLFTPYGLVQVVARSAVTADACKRYIMEWVSPFIIAQSQWPAVGAVTVVLLVVVVWWLIQQLRQHKVDDRFVLVAMLSLIGVPFGIAGMFALRFLGVSVLTLTPLFGAAITVMVRRLGRWSQEHAGTAAMSGPAGRWSHPQGWRVVLTISLAMLSPGVLLLGPVAHAVPAENAALAALPNGCTLFTTASIADAAILARPDVKVYYDGRADYYGEQRLADARTYLLGKGKTSAPAGSSCIVLAEPGTSDEAPAATARLNNDRNWHHNRTVNGFDIWTLAVTA